MKNILSKIETGLIYVFIFAIPFQFRYIFLDKDWVFSEWRSASLYVTDIILFVVYLLWFLNRGKEDDKTQVKLDGADKALLIFLAVSLLSLKNVIALDLGVYYFIKLLEGFALYFYLKYYATERFRSINLAWALIAGAVFQSLIAVAQYIKQGSIGWGLQYFGEGFLRSDMQGVAVFYNAVGEKIMRAYGTTPHPNILSAYLLIALIFFVIAYISGLRRRWWSVVAYSIVIFGFLATFSRTTIFAWMIAWLAVLIYVYIKKGDKAVRTRLWRIVGFTLLICTIFSGLFYNDVKARLTISSGEEAVVMRMYYNKAAFRTGWADKSFVLKALSPVINQNWTGIGLGNFVTWLMKYNHGLSPYYYQPAHNIFLLVFSETGIFGIVALLWFLWRVLKQTTDNKQLTTHNSRLIKNNLQLSTGKIINFGVMLVLGLFLFLCLFDHFPWTLQQGRLMFWGLLGLAGARHLTDRLNI